MGCCNNESKNDYFKNNYPIKKDVYRKRLALRTLSGDNTHTLLQGGCYIPERDHFVMAIVNSDFDSAMVVELDRDYKTVIKRSKMDIGHANDLTYNPNTGKIYVATGDTGSHKNKIIAINSETLALETSIDLKTQTAKWLCSYDDENDLFYVLDTKYLYTYDSEWSLKRKVPNTFKDDFVGKCEMTAQSSFCYKGRFIAVYFSKDSIEGSQQISGLYLQLINPKTGEIESVATYSPRGNADESEFVAMVGDVGYLFGGQTYFSVSELYFDRGKTYEPENSIFGTSTLVDADSDLDDYQTPGIYFSPNTAYTSGMKNCPVKTGFSLYVLPVSGNVIIQELIGSAGDIYKRVLSSTQNKFLDWEIMQSGTNESFIRADRESVHTIKLNKNSAILVFLPYGNNCNMYMVSESGGNSLCRALIKTISVDVNVVKGDSEVSFECSTPLGMIAWRLA